MSVINTTNFPHGLVSLDNDELSRIKEELLLFVKNIDKELSSRQDGKNYSYGFKVPTGGYLVYESLPEAYDAALRFYNGDESAYYKVHKIFI